MSNIARITGIAILGLVSLHAASPSTKKHHVTPSRFVATAFSTEGTSASGKWSHPGTVAADRRVLPLNSKIRIEGAGQYSGEYKVEDTGGKVAGNHIDIFMASRKEAKAFGRQHVTVTVITYGDDQPVTPDPQQKTEAKAENREAKAAAATTPPNPR